MKRVLYRQVGRANGYLQYNRSLPVDVLENDASYLVVFDAPGTEPEDVQVRYLEGSVHVRLERFREFRDGFALRFPGRGMTLDGEAELPGDATVDPDAGTARLSETGTLRIEIPKEAAAEDDEAVESTTAEEPTPAGEPEPTTATSAEEVTVED